MTPTTMRKKFFQTVKTLFVSVYIIIQYHKKKSPGIRLFLIFGTYIIICRYGINRSSTILCARLSVEREQKRCIRRRYIIL